MEKGWVKLHRDITEWEWHDDINVSWLFTHLLLTANYKDTKYRGYDVPAGSRVIGLNALASQTPLSVRQIRTALDKLKSTGELTIKTTNKFSIISITNWCKYQDNDKQMTNERQTDDKRATTSKESKKGKKVRSNKKTGITITEYINSEEFINLLTSDEQLPLEWGNKAAEILDTQDDSEIYLQWNKFIDYYEDKQILRTSWSRSWNNWVLKAKQFKDSRNK